MGERASLNTLFVLVVGGLTAVVGAGAYAGYRAAGRAKGGKGLLYAAGGAGVVIGGLVLYKRRVDRQEVTFIRPFDDNAARR